MKVPPGIEGLSAYPTTLSALWSHDSSSSLIIERYQRPYSWSDLQIETLFKDQFFPLADSTHNSTLSNSFIGAVVLLPGRSGQSEVVDGQQRLTTLTMILGLACKMLKNMDHEIPATCRKFYKLHSAEHWIKVKPVNKSCYEKVIDPEFSQVELDRYLDVVLHSDPEDIMANGVKIIQECIKDFVQVFRVSTNNLGKTNGDAISHLLEILSDNLGLVVVTVNSHGQALSVFEALNAGGMPLTLDQLVKSLLLKTFDKSGPAIAAQIDDFWEGDSADSFLKCLKSSSQRSSFLLYYYKAFVGPIKHKSAYSAYKSYFESIHSDGANPELSCRKLLIHLKSYWVFYSSFNPLLYQLGGEILIPVLFSSREVVQKSGCSEDKIISEMSRISFCLECGFSRVIFLKSKLSAVDARIVGLCKTILKCKNSKDIVEEIKSFYRHTSFGLNDDSDFRKSIEEFKFKSNNKAAILLLRRANEAMREDSTAAGHQLELNNPSAKYSLFFAEPYNANIASKTLLSMGYSTDGIEDRKIYKVLTNSIGNLILTSDMTSDPARTPVNKPFTKTAKINRAFLEDRAKEVSKIISRVWSID